ncbi:hypothetical protein [uncultured Photobacterium sp.]|uniref:hypothetical protein n=1 Tax=uncultured Photobacterium sp. TaxID=173973 RepID=UPI0026228821|nr:hypothetical protein [uncultured Photobacterium sp.]
MSEQGKATSDSAINSEAINAEPTAEHGNGSPLSSQPDNNPTKEICNQIQAESDSKRDRQMFGKQSPSPRKTQSGWFEAVFNYGLMILIVVFAITVYHYFFVPKQDTSNEVKLAVISLEENVMHVRSQGGSDKDVIRYNETVIAMLNQQGYLVLDSSTVHGKIPAEYTPPKININSLTQYNAGTKTAHQ